MEQSEVINIIQQQLPRLIAQDASVRDFVLRTVSEFYINRTEADSKFDRILAELERDRQEQARKWDEQAHKWDEALAEIRRLDRRFESTIGALGFRWGIASEMSFRNALAGILTKSFSVEVLNPTIYDHEGEVFDRPDQVELDLIIKNGLTIACEIKSSIDKAGMYIFDRKVNFYMRHAQRTINRKIVVSPMVDSRALPVAESLGIEIYSYADAVEGL
ncbi:hypothetical protein GlitD10_0547 [Gloeomargarita lithophora Alchichica-D10]|uniref:DUF3782 domain-containing protein n=1 Tax=Gloeomargarita lithophora Alchichica-D10 TaxID=1188229 RepID=A0A1J0AAC6_9CYAN|nr:hypothetical protein GlitD10_0547 [Gloeomargarita lithophora Alchichica-D10]